MVRKFIRKSTFRVALLSRLLAKFIDIFLVLILSFAFYPIGIILSIIYLGWSDALKGGQSVGKSFIGFNCFVEFVIYSVGISEVEPGMMRSRFNIKFFRFIF